MMPNTNHGIIDLSCNRLVQIPPSVSKVPLERTKIWELIPFQNYNLSNPNTVEFYSIYFQAFVSEISCVGLGLSSKLFPK